MPVFKKILYHTALCNPESRKKADVADLSSTITIYFGCNTVRKRLNWKAQEVKNGFNLHECILKCLQHHLKTTNSVVHLGGARESGESGAHPQGRGPRPGPFRWTTYSAEDTISLQEICPSQHLSILLPPNFRRPKAIYPMLIPNTTLARSWWLRHINTSQSSNYLWNSNCDSQSKRWGSSEIHPQFILRTLGHK